MSSAWKDRKKYADVLGRRMAYIDEGEGSPIVLLHGNPTSSYLWRHVIPELRGKGRIIAPDLIGMGDSEKLPPGEPDRYRFVGHRRYLDTLLAALGVVDDVTLVLHDWGSALGFDWARRHPGSLRGIAYMESITQPLQSWEAFPGPVRALFQAFRTDDGEALVLDDNAFVETVLPGAIVRTLSEEEMNEYRRPFTGAGEDRRATLTWPREIPVGGEPQDVHDIVDTYGRWLAETPGIPKLFINGDPGAILRGPQRDFCRGWPDQVEITVAGTHFLQEDAGAEIGQAIATWLPEHD